ncbi:GNAT family N-acetyltransferase [Heyndrickxia sp. MSNUG]|uniref:GNAT family N-acetyltransferase n=1 Tax=Heyndrickxia sp. MSNUG TaxID=3136677 RepID=UPI003C300A82
MKKKISLEGPTVTLMPMEMEQLNDLWNVAQAQEIWEFTASKIKSKEDMKLTIEAATAEREKGIQMPFVVVDKESGKMIGSSRYLDVSSSHKSLEIGWTWYHPDYWRTRVNTETKFLMLQYAFEEMDMNRVQFCTDFRNIRSQTAISRLGAKKEGVLRRHRVIADGYVRDTVVFSIIKEEWPMVKLTLQDMMKRI